MCRTPPEGVHPAQRKKERANEEEAADAAAGLTAPPQPPPVLQQQQYREREEAGAVGVASPSHLPPPHPSPPPQLLHAQQEEGGAGRGAGWGEVADAAAGLTPPPQPPPTTSSSSSEEREEEAWRHLRQLCHPPPTSPEPPHHFTLPPTAAGAAGRERRQAGAVGTHDITLRPSSVSLHVVLPSPPGSSLPDGDDPPSDLARASSPTVTRFLATVVTDSTLSSPAASALVTELVDFAAAYRLDYHASLLECLAAAAPHLATMLLAPEEDLDALDIPTLRSFREAISGEYFSQWKTAMDAEMASWKSTGTYVDKVPPPGANIVSGMWIFGVKRPSSSPPAFKARYVARGFSQ
ncbi:unnamed protein product [Closterium sp. NIES-54]